MSRALLMVFVLAGVTLLAACGKKGPPAPAGPPNEITWPRAYPTH
jgi:predicted small lipoprotein YifL